MASDNSEVTTDDFKDHGGVLKLLRAAQDVETDVREIVREVHAFLDDKDGQWDDHAQKAFKGRPRYTLDKCNDLVDDIAGAMEKSDFDIQVLPAGGDSTKDLAKTYDGLIRNIQNLSDASDVYDAANRNVVRAGMDGWRINQRWGDNNTFDQDLYIDTVADFVDRVWFDENSVLQTREDAEYAFVLTSMTKRSYKQKFPHGKGKSVSIGDHTSSQSDRTPENIVVGEILYKIPVKRRIVELTTGAVYVDDEKFQKIQDELAQEGATVKRERTRDTIEVKTRIFDGSDWLTPVQNTVFDMLPIIPQYANFGVRQQVPNYWGIVTKKLDAQRIYNYTESRKVEEGALAPLAKIMVTKTQIGGEKQAWERLNVSSDPALTWEPDPDAPAPYKIGGAEINPGLESTSQSMLQNLQSTAGIDQLPNQPLGLQSGLAVELKQNRGDTRNWKYMTSKQIAVCLTGKILMRAIPRVYDTERQVRIINEDSSFEMVTLNERVVDTQTEEPVEVIDLSKGVYDVTCEVSKSFKNRQGETVNSVLEVANIDPTIIEEGKDVLYKSINAPGFDLLAERARQKMLLNGSIPEEQMTEDEVAFLQNQPEPPPDPVAEALRRQAEADDDRIQISAIDAARKDRELGAKIAKQERDEARETLKDAMNQVKLAADVLNKQADSWNKMREAMGLDTITGPEGIKTFIDQVAVVQEAQAEQP